ncbi:MAG TPA: cation diffusion facilitator family transporter [Dehalococcoidia bacterium]|nr:cation diffusion facilitator family transporter [Dehalococcoidia bacterium]
MTGPVRIAAISLGTTVGLLALKLTLGIISGSIAVLSDAIDSATDLVGGTAALVSVRVAIWPADEDHPYGHGKVESISASVAATVVAIGCGFVVFQAVRRLVEGSPEIDVVVGVAPMIVAALANLALTHYMRREARNSQSLALASESTHLQTNVVQAMAVIAGLAAVAITNERLFDPLVALGLAAYMAWTAVQLAREALSEIMDVALPDDELRAIQDAIAAHTDDIRGFHRLRSRRAGPTRHVDMHLIVDPQRTVEEAHTVCDEIEREIQKHLPGAVVTIHMEPDDGRYRGPLERILHEHQ